MSDLEDLMVPLALAQEEFQKAASEESQARAKRTDALNRLNDVQKAFDAAMEALRSEAPRDSDWGSRRRK